MVAGQPEVSPGGLLTPAEREVLRDFVAGLRARLGASTVESIAVFGSRARGDAREDSDLDVAVKLAGGEERAAARAVHEAAADVSSEDIHLRPIVILPRTPLRASLRASLEREGVTVYQASHGRSA